MPKSFGIRALARIAWATCCAACAAPVGATPDAGSSNGTPTAAELLAARPYTVTAPTGYDASTPWPLLIVLAGAGDEAQLTSSWLGYTGLEADAGYFLVAPDPDPANGRYTWDPSPAHAPHFDVEYLTAVIRDLESKYSIASGEVFIAGHSDGAHMAHRMACDDSPDVAAIMSLAGQVPESPLDCAPTQAVSVLQVHGTDDQIIGYNGDVQNNPPDPTIPSAHQTVAVWARNDHCTGSLEATGQSYDLDSSLSGDETTVEAYSGCPSGVAVDLWSIVGGSHDPEVTPAFAPLTWEFLKAHARP